MSSGMLEDGTDSNDESSEITIVKVRPRDWLIQPEPDETHERNNNNAISTYEVYEWLCLLLCPFSCSTTFNY